MDHNNLAANAEEIRVEVTGADLSNVERAEVAKATIIAMDAIQGLPARVQIMAVASLFYLIIKATQLRPLDVLGYCSNLARDKRHSSRMLPQFAALMFHLKTWLLQGGKN